MSAVNSMLLSFTILCVACAPSARHRSSWANAFAGRYAEPNLFAAIDPTSPVLSDSQTILISAPLNVAKVQICESDDPIDCVASNSAKPGELAATIGERKIFRILNPLAILVGTRVSAVGLDKNGTAVSTLAMYFDLKGMPATILPDPNFTVGEVCTQDNPDFSRLRYKAQIPYCERNVSYEEKLQVAKAYGIRESDFAKYEFDHFIPLSSGGSNSARNLWPQPLGEAKVKDAVEYDLYQKFSYGNMTQADAVKTIRDWRLDPATANGLPIPASSEDSN